MSRPRKPPPTCRAGKGVADKDGDVHIFQCGAPAVIQMGTWPMCQACAETFALVHEHFMWRTLGASKGKRNGRWKYAWHWPKPPPVLLTHEELTAGLPATMLRGRVGGMGTPWTPRVRPRAIPQR